MMLMGLTVANLAGVPVSTVLGQYLGWRSTFLAVTVIGVAAVAAVVRWVPAVPLTPGASPRQELGALRRPQVWLTVLTAAIGFGGFFAVYSYITPTLTTLSGVPRHGVPVVLMLFGLGMTLGNLVGGRLADWSVMRTICLGLGAVIAVLLAFQVTVHSAVPAALTVLALGATGSAAIPALQTRLMDVAGDAQSLAAALNHSALNIANALGAWLGGLVIAAGYGYASPAMVGALLALVGLGVALTSVLLARRRQAVTTSVRLEEHVPAAL